ncbi:hypothetical protein IE53DRAFT_363668 [Violaceomyces palustris]|uniref:Uncharacterized protein n=1 Tax=Violaceomyces palustris TaxID=1673888 RepID=A0ACD0NSG6_9BASI|nr:hypothetical protein IE53DRAFT_363668 [Violaceomyces palustris]
MAKAKAPPRPNPSSRPTQPPPKVAAAAAAAAAAAQQQQRQSSTPTQPSSPSLSNEQIQSSSASSKKKKKKSKSKSKDAEAVNGQEYDSPTMNSAAHPRPRSPGAYSATAKAQADLLATASDLYRRIEADPQGIPDDDAYWTSLPAHLRTFIRNALPLGQFPPSAQAAVNGNPNDPNTRHASTQAMIAVAQQLAQAAHASQRHLQQFPPGTHPYPPLPFDPSIFADLALHPEQALPLHPHPNAAGTNAGNQPNGAHSPFVHGRAHVQYATSPNPPPTQPPGEPLPAPVVLVNEYGEETGDYDDEYYSDDELDHDGGMMGHRGGMMPDNSGVWIQEDISSVTSAPNGVLGSANGEQTATKKNKKKKKKKSGTGGGGGIDVAGHPAGGIQAQPLQAARPGQQQYAPASNNNATLAQSQGNRPGGNQVQPPPSSRAAGKQPMTFNSSNAKAAARPANGSGVPPPSSTAAAGSNPPTRIWSTSSVEERERIKEFWLGLSEKERRELVKLEKETVLKKMKDQQKHGCSCAVCGRKRTAIEDELEVLYDAYYDELEDYANHQQRWASSGGSVALDSNGAVIGGDQITQPRGHPHPAAKKGGVIPPESSDGYDEDELDDEEYDEEDEDEEYEDEEEDEEAELEREREREEAAAAEVKKNAGVGQGVGRRRAPSGQVNQPGTGQGDLFGLGSSLTVKGGILTVADDLLKNDGQKFLEMMEQLAERRMQREEEAGAEFGDSEDEDEDDMGDEDDDDDENLDDEDDEDQDDAMTDEQRMEEGRRMFQIFAARMFEQRVLQAYRERVAQERQLQLLRELEEEDMNEKAKEAKRAKENQKKKDKKRQLKQQKEEERLRKEQERAAEEAAAKARAEKQREAELKKQEEARLKREAERKAKEEERARKEEEKRKRLAEEKERELERERKKKEKEEKARLEREAKETKEKERKLKEEEARRAREQREVEERERKAKEERERKAEAVRKEKEAAEKAAAQAKAQAQQQQQRSSIAARTPAPATVSASGIGAPSLAPVPPTGPRAAQSTPKSSANASQHQAVSATSGARGRNASVPSSPAISQSAPRPGSQQQQSVGGGRGGRNGQSPAIAGGAQAQVPASASSSLPAPPQGLPPRPSSAVVNPLAHLQSSQVPSSSTSTPASVGLPRPPVSASLPTTSVVGSVGFGSIAAQSSSSVTASQSIQKAGGMVSPKPLQHGSATGQTSTGQQLLSQQHTPVSTPSRSTSGGYGQGTFDSLRSPTLPNGLPPTMGLGAPGKLGLDSVLQSPVLGIGAGLGSATSSLASLNLGAQAIGQQPSKIPGSAGLNGIGQGPASLMSQSMPSHMHNQSPLNQAPGTTVRSRAPSLAESEHFSGLGLRPPSSLSHRAIQRPTPPTPIGPIGRPRHTDSIHHDDGLFGPSPIGRSSSVSNAGTAGSGSGPTSPKVPEGILGSSALGGDDELIEPKPRRTSNTAPITAGGGHFYGIGVGSVGTGAFGMSSSSPWSAFSGAGPAAPGSQSAGFSSAPGVGSPGSLGLPHSAGLSQASGAVGVGVGSAASIDPWARAQNSWDRARFAFESPGGSSAVSSGLTAGLTGPPGALGQIHSPPSHHLHGGSGQLPHTLAAPGLGQSHAASVSSHAGGPLSPFGAPRSIFGAPGHGAIGQAISPTSHSSSQGNDRGL